MLNILISMELIEAGFDCPCSAFFGILVIWEDLKLYDFLFGLTLDIHK